jgi:hypothetical protein
MLLAKWRRTRCFRQHSSAFVYLLVVLCFKLQHTELFKSTSIPLHSTHRVSLCVSYDCQNKTVVLFLHNIKKLVFVMETGWFVCDELNYMYTITRTEFRYCHSRLKVCRSFLHSLHTNADIPPYLTVGCGRLQKHTPNFAIGDSPGSTIHNLKSE